MYYFITINIVVQLPGVPEGNSTHSDDPNRQHTAPPQIVVGETLIILNVLKTPTITSQLRMMTVMNHPCCSILQYKKVLLKQ